jgi:hypothetical protein
MLTPGEVCKWRELKKEDPLAEGPNRKKEVVRVVEVLSLCSFGRRVTEGKLRPIRELPL